MLNMRPVPIACTTTMIAHVENALPIAMIGK